MLRQSELVAFYENELMRNKSVMFFVVMCYSDNASIIFLRGFEFDNYPLPQSVCTLALPQVAETSNFRLSLKLQCLFICLVSVNIWDVSITGNIWHFISSVCLCNLCP